MFEYRLPGKLPGEKIIKIIRKDALVLAGRLLLTAILVGLPAAVGFIMLNIYPNLLEGEISYPLIVLATSGYALFIWLFMFFSFIDYYLDVWLITSERIIDIKQEGFFSRTVSETKLSEIQDVTSELKGFLRFVFHCGDVYVQTAAEQQRCSFIQVPGPEAIRDTIIKLIEEKKHAAIPSKL